MSSSEGLSTSRPLACGIAALASAVALSARAADPPTLVVYVDQSAPQAGQDGMSWAHAFRDLRDAIQAAQSKLGYPGKTNLEMRIAQGTYKPDRGTLDPSACFDFSFYAASGINFSFLGSFAGLAGPDPDKQDFVSTRTVLSGDLKGDDQPDFANRIDNSARLMVIYLNVRAIKIEGVTFRAGNNPSLYGSSGLICSPQNYTSSLNTGQVQIVNCRFEENQTFGGSGAGLNARGSFVAVSRSDFIGNRSIAGLGAGATITPASSSNIGMYSCKFENNSAVNGGAVYLPSDYTIAGCIFAGNTASVQGGAIFGEAEIVSSLFLRNSAESSGGAIAASGDGWLSVRMSTFAMNRAPVAPAISTYSTQLDLQGAIIWDNVALEVNAPMVRAVDTIRQAKVKGSIIQGGVSALAITGVPPVIDSTIVDANPQFIRPAAPDASIQDWKDWNYRLRPASPAKRLGGELSNYSDLDNHSLDWNDPRADAGAYFADNRSCPADLNRDYPFAVDDADFAIFADAYNTMISPPANPDADFNRDGLVDDADFSLFVVAYDQLLCN